MVDVGAVQGAVRAGWAAAETQLRAALPLAAQPYTSVVLGAAVALLLFVLTQVLCCGRRRPSNAPKVVGGGLPLIGSMVQFGRDPVGFVTALNRKHGPVFTVNVMGRSMTYLIGAEAQTAFFKADDEELSAKDAYQFMVPVFGKGIVYDCPLAVMKEQLKMVRVGLSAERLKTYVPKMVAECNEYFARFPDEGDLDLMATFADLIILTASNCLLGAELRKHMGTRVAELYKVFDDALTPLSFFAPNLPLPNFRARNRAREEMYAKFKVVIVKRRAEGVRHDDMLQSFMEATYKDGSHLTDDQICGMLLAALFGGQHTSSITASWVGLCLMNNPDYLARVLEEQKQVYARYGGLTFDALKDMVVFENAILETLRMHPPLVFLMRKVLKPIEACGKVLPPGDLAVVSPTIGHMLPEVFENPDKWDPDRFARGEHLKQSFGWFGFGGGKHGCIGEKFGLLQVKTIWSTLLRDFEWSPYPRIPPPNYHSMVVGPTPPAIMHFRRRRAAKSSSA